MTLIPCIHYDSNNYKQGKSIKPIGIVVHSTGAANTSIKRYAQPSKTDPNYDKIISIIGLNKNKNSWNRGVSKGVHYIVGKLADKSIGTAHILPETISAWGVGKGKKGSYNYNPTAHIQFEICEDSKKNGEYLLNVFKEAVELCADICTRYGWTSKAIVSHKECYKLGYGSNHGDPENWLSKFGYTMDDFRKAVDTYMKKG